MTKLTREQAEKALAFVRGELDDHIAVLANTDWHAEVERIKKTEGEQGDTPEWVFSHISGCALAIEAIKKRIEEM